MTANYRYPFDLLDNRGEQIALLGSFWSDLYQQDEVVKDILYSRAQQERQSLVGLQEAAACVARRDIPVGQLRLWYRLVLRESQRNSSAAVAVTYGTEAGNYGGSLHYGDTSAAYSNFVVDTGLLEIPLICNRLSLPSLVLFADMDFTLDVQQHVLTLRENPFAEGSLWAIRNVYEGTEQVDREASLWLFRPRFDRQYLWQHFGYPLGLRVPETVAGKTFLNAVWDAVVEGASTAHLLSVVAAALDVPLVRQDEETVEVIDANDPLGLLIVTDKEVYRFARNATPVVDLGDVVYRGDILVDVVELFVFNRGTVPSADKLPALTLGREVLGQEYHDGISFENRNQATRINTDGTHTELTFPVGGWNEDVVRFWAALQQRGIADSTTLAELLDDRDNKIGQPQAGNLPTSINPLEFLIANVLRANAGALKIKPGLCGRQALSWECLQILRKLLPPHALWLLVTELVGPAAEIRMEGDGSAAGPGFASVGLLQPAIIADAAVFDSAYIQADTGTLVATDGGCL